MYVKTISATYIKKIDMGNYQSVDLQVSAWADTGSADLEESNRMLWKLVRASVSQQAIRISKEEKVEPMPPINADPAEYDPRRFFVKTISVKYSRKIKPDPTTYGLLTAEYACFANLDPADDLLKCLDAMWEMARQNIIAQLKPVMLKQEVDLENAFLGLPADIQSSYFESVANQESEE